MPSDVWFWNLRASRKAPPEKKILRLLDAAGLKAALKPGDLTAVKIHFGEGGVTRQVSPLSVKPVVDYLKDVGARPFLTDTNTLYAGNRGNAADHGMQAARHGFDPLLTGAPVIIADGLRSSNEVGVPLPGSGIKTAWLARDIVEADFLVNVSHFKGHELAGFGGALKNVAMGCATRRGKMAQHGCLAPMTKTDNCVGCGDCLTVCAPGALSLGDDGRITVDPERCAGCGSCFHVCRVDALMIDWRTDILQFLQRMMEYAAAALTTRARPAFHLSFALGVTPDCDCPGFSDAPVCPDIGVLASWDPVALDKACLDLVAASQPAATKRLPEGIAPGVEKFKAVHPHTMPAESLDIAASLGLGSLDYDLKEI